MHIGRVSGLTGSLFKLAMPLPLVAADVRLGHEHGDGLQPARRNASEVRHRQQFFLAGLGSLVHFAEQALGSKQGPVRGHGTQPVLPRMVVVGIRLQIADHVLPPFFALAAGAGVANALSGAFNA